jgi:hypothetical protein
MCREEILQYFSVRVNSFAYAIFAYLLCVRFVLVLSVSILCFNDNKTKKMDKAISDQEELAEERARAESAGSKTKRHFEFHQLAFL